MSIGSGLEEAGGCLLGKSGGGGGTFRGETYRASRAGRDGRPGPLLSPSCAPRALPRRAVRCNSAGVGKGHTCRRVQSSSCAFTQETGAWDTRGEGARLSDAEGVGRKVWGGAD